MLKHTLLFIALTAQTIYAQTKSKVTVTDLTRIKQVAGIELAPDGQHARTRSQQLSLQNPTKTG